jgi:hypothetical protein
MPEGDKAMSIKAISNLQWAMSVLEELPTETIEQDRAISISVAAIQDKIDSLCEQESKNESTRGCGYTNLKG